jgi:hypothetical protein
MKIPLEQLMFNVEWSKHAQLMLSDGKKLPDNIGATISLAMARTLNWFAVHVEEELRTVYGVEHRHVCNAAYAAHPAWSCRTFTNSPGACDSAVIAWYLSDALEDWLAGCMDRSVLKNRADLRALAAEAALLMAEDPTCGHE